MIHFSCPTCQSPFQVGDNMAGAKFCCGCGQAVTVPVAQIQLPPVENHRGELILLFGILGFFIPPLALTAFIFGASDEKKMLRGRMDVEGKTFTVVGMYLGKFVTIIWGFVLLFWLIVVGASISSRL